MCKKWKGVDNQRRVENFLCIQKDFFSVMWQNMKRHQLIHQHSIIIIHIINIAYRIIISGNSNQGFEVISGHYLAPWWSITFWKNKAYTVFASYVCVLYSSIESKWFGSMTHLFHNISNPKRNKHEALYILCMQYENTLWVYYNKKKI